MNLGGERILELAKQYWQKAARGCEGHKKCETLDEFLENHKPSGNFRAVPFFNKEGNQLELYLADEPSFGRWHHCPESRQAVADSHWSDEDDGKLVGFTIFGVLEALAKSGYVVIDSREIEKLQTVTA